MAAEVLCGVERNRWQKWRGPTNCVGNFDGKSSGRRGFGSRGLGSGLCEGLRTCQPLTGLGLGDTLQFPKEDFMSAANHHGHSARMQEGTEDKIKRTGGQSLMQSWDSSQVENGEEKESWQERDQMAAQWDEEQKMEEILERRRMEGSSLHFEAVRNEPELVVHERMSQGIGVNGV